MSMCRILRAASLALLAFALPGGAGAASLVIHDAPGNLERTRGSTGEPPAIVGEPADVVSVPGATASLSVLARGTEPLAYRWRFGTNGVAGAAGGTLFVTNATVPDGGGYSVVVSNLFGAVTSRVATLDLDTDGDELGDAWEIQHFGDITSQTAWTDFDGDGVLNGEEQEDGTSPESTAAHFYRLRITSYGSGEVRRFPSRARYAGGTTVTCMAVRVGAGGFYRWNGTLQSTSTILVATMTQDISETAYFDPPPAVAAWGNHVDGETSVPAGLTNLVALAGGWRHSLALTTDGRVTEWGDNTFGQMNMPAGLSNVVAVAAGALHSLALKADGSVVAWGDNLDLFGELDVPAGLSNVVQVVAGTYHSLALAADGTVTAWGYDGYGQAEVPESLANVVALEAGWYHSLALMADGRVTAWGSGSGYGETNVPGNLSNVVAIAGGIQHSLAMTADGRVTAWGAGGFGATNVPAALTDAVAVAAGDYYSLAQTADGRVVAWGANDAGQVTVPEWVAGGAGASAGGSHVLALVSVPGAPLIGWMTPNRQVYGQPFTLHGTRFTGATTVRVGGVNAAFTVNADDRVTVTVPASAIGVGPVEIVTPSGHGYGPRLFVPTTDTAPTDLSLTPASVVEQVPTGTVVGVWQTQDADLGDSFTYSLVSGTGSQNNAQFTITNNQLRTAAVFNYETTNAYSIRVRTTDSRVRTLEKSFTVSVINNLDDDDDADGLTEQEELSYGSNPLDPDSDHDGWLDGAEASAGTSLTNALSKPQAAVVAWGTNFQGQVSVPPGLTNVAAVGAGGSLSVAVTADGRVRLWGDFGTTNVPANVSNVVAATAGAAHRIALTASGRVLAWGDNTYGQTNVPASLSNAVAIASAPAASYSVGLGADGRVIAWGYGFNGETNVPEAVSNVVAVAAGRYHTVAILADGTVRAWGLDYNNLLSVPADLSNVVAVAAGTFHSLALSADGHVTAWGDGGNVAPPDLSNVVGIACGEFHSLALTSNGVVRAWGNGLSGQTNVPAWFGGGVGVAGGTAHSLGIMTVPGAPLVGWMSSYRRQAGQTFELHGARLTGLTAVRIGGTNAAFAVNADDRVTVMVPSGATSLGRVEVFGPNGHGYGPRLFAAAAAVIVDTDGDGIPDAWELAHGLYPGVSNSPTSNADGDALTDRQEYEADTNPTNPASFFDIQAFSGKGPLKLTVNPSSTARVYDVYWKTNPLPSNLPWVSLNMLRLGTGTNLVFSFTNATPRAHYRAGVRLP